METKMYCIPGNDFKPAELIIYPCSTFSSLIIGSLPVLRKWAPGRFEMIAPAYPACFGKYKGSYHCKNETKKPKKAKKL